MTKRRARQCAECGALFTPRQDGQLFCSCDCNKAFQNRRAVRGAELYDVFMALRFERDKAKSEALWTLCCSLARHYRDEDKHTRAGRKSWNIESALKRIPLAYSCGDGR